VVRHPHQAPAGTGCQTALPATGVCGLSAHDADYCPARPSNRGKAQAIFPCFVRPGPICFGDQYVPGPNWIITELQAKEDGRGAGPVGVQKNGWHRGLRLRCGLMLIPHIQWVVFLFDTAKKCHVYQANG